MNYHIDVTGSRIFNNVLRATERCQEGETFAVLDGRYAEEIQKERRDKWGFKDPRLCLPNLLDGFIKASGEADIRMIGIRRDLESSVKSFFKILPREDRPRIENGCIHFLKLFQDSYNSFDGPKMMVHYDALIEDTETTLKRVADFCEVRVTQEAIDFIDPGLRRN